MQIVSDITILTIARNPCRALREKRLLFPSVSKRVSSRWFSISNSFPELRVTPVLSPKLKSLIEKR